MLRTTYTTRHSSKEAPSLSQAFFLKYFFSSFKCMSPLLLPVFTKEVILIGQLTERELYGQLAHLSYDHIQFFS